MLVRRTAGKRVFLRRQQLMYSQGCPSMGDRRHTHSEAQAHWRAAARSMAHEFRYYNEARPKERSDRGYFLPLGIKASSYRVAYRVPLFNLSVCVSVSVCITFVVFTDCESCTRPISTNPGSMEAGEYGLTRGTCFLACRLELDAVAGLLWISWCVSGGANFFSVLSMSLHFQIHS